MGSRFFEGLSLADLVTLGNAVVGLLAIRVTFAHPELAARLILLAAVADGVDGVLARHVGGSDIGPYLDSLADVSSFSLAPAALVSVVAADLDLPLIAGLAETAVLAAVPALYVALAVLRLGVYTVHDTANTATIGAPTTLAAGILCAAMLTVHGTPAALWIGCLVLSLVMVAPVEYPDLLARDALLMGVIHGLAVVAPRAYGRIFPYALLTLALAYFLFAPHFYWGQTERELRGPPSPKGKRS